MIPTDASSGNPAAEVSIRERLRSVLPALSPAERRVGDAVLRDPLAVIHLSVSELAAIAETSPATVVRLCVSLGLRGYHELKITLATESSSSERQALGEIAPGDDTAQIMAKVMEGTARAVTFAAENIDSAVLDTIVGHVLGARRVLFGAVGTSAPLALDAAYRLNQLGIDASFAPDVHTQRVTARMLRPGDVLFAISHSGSTFETLATARSAQASGATTIALTSFSRSPLTEVVDLSLVAGSEETAYRVEAMVSRVVHLTVLDALFVALTLRSPTSRAHLALTEDVLVEHRL